MLVLLLALTKDLMRDPLILRRRLASTVLEESVIEAVEEHDGTFTLTTADAPSTPVVVTTARSDALSVDPSDLEGEGTSLAVAPQGEGEAGPRPQKSPTQE